MAKSRNVTIPMPVGGVDRSGALSEQRPRTTPSALNVWPVDYSDKANWDEEHYPESPKGRARIAVRPGRVDTGSYGGGSNTLIAKDAFWNDADGESYAGLVLATSVDARLIKSDGTYYDDVERGAAVGDWYSATVGNDYMFYTAWGSTAGFEPRYKTIDGTNTGDVQIDSHASLAGIVPEDCGNCAWWQSRLVLANQMGTRNKVHFSRVGAFYDWDYTQIDEGAAAELEVNGNIQSLIPHSEQTLIIGCEDSMYALNSGPNVGSIYTVSRQIAPLYDASWCFGPDGTYMLTKDGIYLLPAGQHQRPVPISRGKLPEQMTDLDVPGDRAAIAYDSKFQGLHVVINRSSGNDFTYFFHIPTQSFWPQDGYTDNLVASVPGLRDSTRSNCVFWTSAGSGYAYDVDDTGDSFDAYIWIGPIYLGGDGLAGLITEISGVLGDTSEGSDVDYEVYAGNSAEEAFSKTTPDYTGSGWSGTGLQYVENPLVRGRVAYVKVETSGVQATRRWSLENIRLRIAEAGPARKI